MMPFICSFVFFCISEKEGKGEEQSVAGTHRDVSFLFLSCCGTTHNCIVKNMPRIQKPLLKYAPTSSCPPTHQRLSTLLLARAAPSQKRAPLVLPFLGGASSSICRDVFLSPVVFSPSRHSKDDVFSRRSVFFPSRRRSRKNGGKEWRRQKTERRRRRVHLRVFFRRFVGVTDCFCVLHVRSIRVRKGGSGTGGETGQGESESGAQDAVCSVAFKRDYCRWK